MKLDKLLLLSCIFLLLTDVLSFRSSEEEDENDIDVDDELAEQEFEKRPVVKKQPLKKHKKKKPQPKETEEAPDDEEYDEDDNYIYACGDRSDERNCKCDTDTLNCEKVLVREQKLRSTNIEIVDTKFAAKYANFKNNEIAILKRGEILPGREIQFEKLDFSNNIISKIESGAFDDFERLLKLDLSNNKLETINSGVLTEELGSTLHVLRLNNNNLNKIPKGAFDNMNSLLVLVLDNNPKLKFTSSMFPKSLAKLKELSLDDCKIDSLDDSIFSYLSALKKLSIRNNPIVAIPKAINAIPTLEALDMSGTNLPELDTNQIAADHKLEEIYLSDMPYLSVDRDCSFCGLPNLKKVVLSGSKQLFEINENAFGSQIKKGKNPMATIKEFNIQNCNFTTLPQNLFNWSAIEKLTIDGNPFVCDCDLAWLINDQSLHSYIKVPKCAAPDEFNGTLFTQIHGKVCDGKTSSTKSTNKSSFLLWSFALFVTTFIVIGGFLVYTRRLRVTNILYRPEVPQMGYSNLTAQQHRDDEEELQNDFQPKPDATPV